jgi:hypothetical protein
VIPDSDFDEQLSGDKNICPFVSDIDTDHGKEYRLNRQTPRSRSEGCSESLLVHSRVVSYGLVQKKQ